MLNSRYQFEINSRLNDFRYLFRYYVYSLIEKSSIFINYYFDRKLASWLQNFVAT